MSCCPSVYGLRCISLCAAQELQNGFHAAWRVSPVAPIVLRQCACWCTAWPFRNRAAVLCGKPCPQRIPLLCSLDKLPFYGAGISSGASFLLKLPRYIKVGGGGTDFGCPATAAAAAVPAQLCTPGAASARPGKRPPTCCAAGRHHVGGSSLLLLRC